MNYLRIKFSIALVPMMVAASGQVPAADICKWRDDQGRVHYSDVAPIGRKCAELIRVVQPDPEAQRQAEERRDRHLAEVRAFEDEKARKRVEAARLSEKDAERERRCQDARAELSFLDEAYGLRLVRSGREGDYGPFDWIDDQEREALIESWRREVRQWCGPSYPSSDSPVPARAYGVLPPPRKRSQ